MRAFIIILIFLVSCTNVDDRIKNEVSERVEDTKAQIDKDALAAETRFHSKFDSIASRVQESQKKEIEITFSYIIDCTKLIDSLQTKLSKLNEVNSNDIDAVRELFITNGQGDSLFNRLKSSYALAKKICLTEKAKINVEKIANNSLNSSNGVSSWKNQFFQQNTPFGVQMILFGLETELLKAGSISFEGY